jgi:hypothetical protein
MTGGSTGTAHERGNDTPLTGVPQDMLSWGRQQPQVSERMNALLLVLRSSLQHDRHAAFGANAQGRTLYRDPRTERKTKTVAA